MTIPWEFRAFSYASSINGNNHLFLREVNMDGTEKLFPVSSAVEQETGQRPHPSTLHRWRLRGIAGVKLETVRCGGRRLCSVESVQRFLDGVTAAADGEQPTPQTRTPRQRQVAIARAEKDVSEQGI